MPTQGPTCGQYFFQGFGVFLGVLAGVIVNYSAGWFAKAKSESQQVKNLKFELQLNIKKINKWLEEITKYRNAVNGDTLDQYFGYFDLSRIIYVTANSMFFSGLLYKYFAYEEVDSHGLKPVGIYFARVVGSTCAFRFQSEDHYRFHFVFWVSKSVA